MKKPNTGINTYQIAGLDDLERGFNRPAEVKCLEDQYQATFRYEALHMVTDLQLTEEAALMNVIHQLQRKGYTQLRSRLQFRGEEYLGNQELWVEHADPAPRGVLFKIWMWVSRR